MTTTTISPRRRTGPSTLSALDVELLRFATRFAFIRGCQAMAWTGGSSWVTRKRLRGLAAHDLIRSSTLSIHLRGDDGKVRPSQCYVWTATPRGAALAGEWEVPGTGGETISLGVRNWSRLTSDHVLGVADLACWYRQSGFAVTAEREILSLERMTGLHPQRILSSYWSVLIPGQKGIHSPDMGAVGPDGRLYAIELERARKNLDQYQDTVAAYRDAGRAQIWHILGQTTGNRIIEACKRLGIEWAPNSPAGVMVSSDGMVRLSGWLPSRVNTGGPESWKGAPRGMPAGLPEPAQRPDLTASWMPGRVIDIDSEHESLGGVMF